MGREVLFEVCDAGADEGVNAGESELAHLLHGFVGGPAFVGHAVGCDGHAGAVVAEAAVQEDYLAGIFRDQLEKSDEGAVVGKRAMPRDGDILHAELGDRGLFALVGAAAHVDDDGDSHVLEAFEGLGTRFASAVEMGRDFAEVWDTGNWLVGGNRMLGVWGMLGSGGRAENEEDCTSREDIWPHIKFDAVVVGCGWRRVILASGCERKMR